MDYEKTLEQLENYFCDLLIMQYRQAPKNRKMVKLLVDTVFANCLTQQIADKTINLQESVGAQLDTVGKWLMVDRNYKADPVFTKQYFAMPSNSQIKNNATLDIQGGMVNYSDFATTTGAVLNYEEEIAVYSQNASLNDTLFKQLCELAAMRNSIQYSMKNIDEAIYEWSNGEVYTTWNKVFNPDAFTIVGSPTITEDGIASGFSSSNYLTIPSFTANESIVITSPVFCPNKIDSGFGLYAYNNTSALGFTASFTSSTAFDVSIYRWRDIRMASSSIEYSIDNYYQAKYVITASTVESYISVNGGEWAQRSSNANTNGTLTIGSILIGRYPWADNPFDTGTTDLKGISITVDGVEVFSGLKTQPLTLTYHYPSSYSQLITLAYNKGILPRPTGVQILLEEKQ